MARADLLGRGCARSGRRRTPTVSSSSSRIAEAAALVEVAGANEQPERQDAQEPAVVLLAALVGLHRLGELEERRRPSSPTGRCAGSSPPRCTGLRLAIPAVLEQIDTARSRGDDSNRRGSPAWIRAAPRAVLALRPLQLAAPAAYSSTSLAQLLHLAVVAAAVEQLGQHAVADRRARVLEQPRGRIGAERRPSSRSSSQLSGRHGRATSRPSRSSSSPSGSRGSCVNTRRQRSAWAWGKNRFLLSSVRSGSRS